MKSGQVLLCGVANAGKSTLINAIANHEFAIVNYKPQTTRKISHFTWTNNDYQLVFMDSPGFHAQKNQLDVYMNQAIFQQFKVADCVAFLFDLTREIDQVMVDFLSLLNKKVAHKLVVIFTKSDLIPPQQLSEHLADVTEQLKVHLNFQHYCVTHQNDREFIKRFLTLTDHFYHAEVALNLPQEQSDQFLVSEIIRNEALKLFHQEVPYGVHIHMEEFTYKQAKNLLYVEAYVICESPSHKKIIVGQKGQMIKKLGINARVALNKIYDCHIYLALQVKVWKQWRNDEQIVKKLF